MFPANFGYYKLARGNLFFACTTPALVVVMKTNFERNEEKCSALLALLEVRTCKRPLCLNYFLATTYQISAITRRYLWLIAVCMSHRIQLECIN